MSVESDCRFDDNKRQRRTHSLRLQTKAKLAVQDDDEEAAKTLAKLGTGSPVVSAKPQYNTVIEWTGALVVLASKTFL